MYVEGGRHTDTCSGCCDADSETPFSDEPSCNNLAAVNEHAAHTQTDGESLSKPYRPVLSFTSASLTATNAKHEHAKRGEDTASGTKQTMVTSIEKAAGDKGRSKEKEGLSSSH